MVGIRRMLSSSPGPRAGAATSLRAHCRTSRHIPGRNPTFFRRNLRIRPPSSRPSPPGEGESPAASFEFRDCRSRKVAGFGRTMVFWFQAKAAGANSIARARANVAAPGTGALLGRYCFWKMSVDTSALIPAFSPEDPPSSRRAGLWRTRKGNYRLPQPVKTTTSGSRVHGFWHRSRFQIRQRLRRAGVLGEFYRQIPVVRCCARGRARSEGDAARRPPGVRCANPLFLRTLMLIHTNIKQTNSIPL